MPIKVGSLVSRTGDPKSLGIVVEITKGKLQPRRKKYFKVEWIVEPKYWSTIISFRNNRFVRHEICLVSE